jgi:hypothetical protein
LDPAASVGRVPERQGDGRSQIPHFRAGLKGLAMLEPIHQNSFMLAVVHVWLLLPNLQENFTMCLHVSRVSHGQAMTSMNSSLKKIASPVPMAKPTLSMRHHPEGVPVLARHRPILNRCLQGCWEAGTVSLCKFEILRGKRGEYVIVLRDYRARIVGLPAFVLAKTFQPPASVLVPFSVFCIRTR